MDFVSNKRSAPTAKVNPSGVQVDGRGGGEECPIRVFLSFGKAIYSICQLRVSIIFDVAMAATTFDIILYFEYFISFPA